MTGNTTSSVSGRISHHFDWHGPCISYDTACSTGLVAILGAVNSLRAGECNMALAGAVNLLLGPTSSYWLNAIQALAPDGRSKAFGAAANGFGRGEGGGAVLLKRLSDAQKDGNRIHAVILGGAVGADGASRSFSTPNSAGQRSVLRRALTNAGVDQEQVGFVEAHGTGTALGDPIEIESTAAVYGDKRATPLRVGSIKSNIGHLEAAAGMASFIKAVCSVRYGILHKSLHCEALNPHLDWESLPIQVNTETCPWPEGYARRIAGVSSFGISGTLAHLLVAEPPEEQTPQDYVPLPLKSRVLVLSATRSEKLPELASRSADRLITGETWGQMCDAAANGRPHMTDRLAVCADSAEEALALLQSFPRGEPSPDSVTGQKGDEPAPALFVFSGQGSQRPGMGRDVYETFPECREALDSCEALAAPLLGHSLLEVMFAENDSRLHETQVTLPAIFSYQFALAALLRARNVQPAAVLGYGLGEYAAAVYAGVFDVDTALPLVVHCGKLLVSEMQEKGALSVVRGTEEDVRPILAALPDISLAAVNSPNSVTIAGKYDAVLQAMDALQKKGLVCEREPIAYAFHCPQIEPVLEPFAKLLRLQSYKAPQVPYLSGKTGKYRTGDQGWAEYFVQQMREPVLFAKALASAEKTIVLELGAAPILASCGQQCIPHAQWLSLHAGHDNQRALAQALAKLFSSGHDLNWNWLAAKPWKPEAAPDTAFSRTVLEPTTLRSDQEKPKQTAPSHNLPSTGPVGVTESTRLEVAPVLPAPSIVPPGQQFLPTIEAAACGSDKQDATASTNSVATTPAMHATIIELGKMQCDMLRELCTLQNSVIRKH